MQSMMGNLGACADPAGFSVRRYLLEVEGRFRDAFYVDDEYPVFKTLGFAATYAFQRNVGANNPTSAALAKNIEPPACLLDLYDFKLEGTSGVSNQNNLVLHMCMRALVLVSSRREIAHYRVRKYAADIGGLVIEAGQFGQPIEKAIVTRITEVPDIQQSSNHLVGWEVLWQHLVQLPEPDYSNAQLRSFPEADAEDVTDLFIDELVDDDFEFDLSKG